jgi:hypothetical protein
VSWKSRLRFLAATLERLGATAEQIDRERARAMQSLREVL